ncbi:hypothetical protein DC3_10230 [Deinococcus cellulosilyticus NBRC 106333 = KACC 11606]|uniref:ArsR family transcriptional regulator n=2 Tax=Deinococcus cellulosilyticus TaxID=401558 RepID=A0A511MYM4_DEIC1|nr:hypothetical protein DC3_10230 [Deinococcus cellulosilyticus NBRC 106333 = KACC 11606]
MVAAFLMDPIKRERIRPFLGQENTVKGAAEELGISISLMHHHTKRMLDLGLIQVVREVPRAGKAIFWYASVADAFYVPFSLTPFETMQAAYLKGEKPWQERFIEGLLKVALHLETPEKTWGVLIRRDHHGDFDVTSSIGPDQEAPDLPGAQWSNWTEIHLTPDEALALRMELQNLWLRYRGKKNGQRYLLRLGLAKTVD